MASYAALTSLLQTLEQIPQSLVHEQIASLHDKVTRLLVIFKDFFPIEDLEGRIRDASYEAEDIIQSQISRQVLSKSIASCGVSSCFWEVISALQNMVPAIHLRRQRLVDPKLHGLGQIINEFESILVDLYNKINDGKVEDLQPGGGEDPLPRNVEDVQPRNSQGADSSGFPASTESTLVGIDADLLQLKPWLNGYICTLEVISIVGMVGIGKTALARNLYNDLLVEQRFDTRAWIVVSQEYNVREMLIRLLDSLAFEGDDELHRMTIQKLKEHVQKILQGRRYLIVMDDVWDTKVWDDVKRIFPDDLTGSRIILTTRLANVADNASYIRYRMSLLSPEASWDLLREKVFGNECCPPELEDIGKRIAKNCKGLPLTIVMIGGILYKGIKSQDYWEYIAENVYSVVSENDNQFMDIFSLSYNLLPHRLRPLFLYMGVFPEDNEIYVSPLIKLWIAEGFIKPIGGQSLEEVAEDYLKDLIGRSLILVRKRKPNGEIKTCIVHDMCREMCLKKAQDEKFLQILNWEVHGFSQGRNNQRQVSVHSNIVDCLTDIHDSSVRSILYFCTPRSDLLSFTMSCRLLKVFDALTVRFYEFPIEILELVHLRFLAFLYRGSNLPASLSKLQNLQTLIVFSIKLLYLPPTIWEMPQLRHLLLEESFLPAQIIGKNSFVLVNLQTLSGVTNFRCTREVFEMMPNLKKLEISYVYDADTQWSYYEFNNFARLHELETLKCLFIPKLSHADRPLPVNLTAFPPNLKKLTLSGCRIPWEKMTVIGSLPNLEVLKLKDQAFEGSVWKTSEGEFMSLRLLLIDMSFLEHWIADSEYVFSKLRHLSLGCCPKLAKIPCELRHLRLLTIELYECSSSAVESAMRIQEEKRDLGKTWLTVRVHSHSDYYKYSQQQTSLRKVMP